MAVRDVDRLADLVSAGGVLVLTGAGISTDSGIPDYRGPGKPVRTPMTYQEFVSGPAAQQRYWARSYVGWRTIGRARPNAGHRALAALERSGQLTGLVTQNVDGLHTAAGHRDVVDLHGRISDVICLGCQQVTPRVELQARLDELNPGFAQVGVVTAPDGDAVLEEGGRFVPARCPSCDGPLKPHLVFFGENVPKPRVQLCLEAVERAEALLVAGSSLAVLSGFRFVRQAKARGIPVAIVNRGPTRGDELADVRLEAGCSEVLDVLAAVAA